MAQTRLVFAATLYAFDGAGRVLLIRHPRLDVWCPPGGKIAPMEFPHEAALRECWEETGYQMHLLAMPAWPWLRPGEPPPPLAIDVGPANGCHLIQLVYCGICGNRSGQGEENIPIRWVSLAELAKISLPDNVRERYWQFRNLPTAGHCDWTTIPDFGE